ncbi:endonuclease/exonuclease/phosphatase family protein [Sulfurospirillum arcachonense]|uniref:endonuclease/exonuclease/phosphatase family protein n=1 Tax=Sulfurospirillum arcachonense TaxID=57666 RepID=UPI00046A2C78|nr:endonuclease/exonuclease/phosphatase family protein [Sulfurospirillum arcachonense]
MIKVVFLLLLPLFLLATQFSVASYNVENLFDIKKSGYEYKEYIPNTKSGWNEKTLSIKIKNLSRVIKDLDADILALQEVENKEVLKRLNLALSTKKYPYMYSSFKTKGVDSVLLSRFPIKTYKLYKVIDIYRPIHKVVVNIKGLHVTFFLNHWPSYKQGNSKRMQYAKALKSFYKKEKNFILLGDFNSPFSIDKQGWGKAVHCVFKDNYNLWYELPFKQRYTHAFFKRRSALDHIIISKDIFYVQNSFNTFKPSYILDKNKNPKRWQISNRGKGKHLGQGYSDHIPIKAMFSTKKLKESKPKDITIKKLITTNKIKVDYVLKDVMVIDKNKYGVNIEDKYRDKIFIYKPDCNFELGNIYTLHVKELAVYKGKKEIVLLDFNSCLDKIND